MVRRTLRQPHEGEFRALPRLVDRARLCVDVGANRGQSIDALRVLGYSRIRAYEPQAVLARRLRHRYPRSIDVRAVGCSERRGTADLYIPVYNRIRFDGLATTDEDYAGLWFEDGIFGFRAERMSVERETIDLVRLDDEDLGDVGFIKLDVQGHELAALRGAEETLVRSQPVLMIERPDEPIHEFLQQLGYRALYWYGARSKLSPPPPDGFYLNVLFTKPHHNGVR